jgi:hypothetical protein
MMQRIPIIYFDSVSAYQKYRAPSHSFEQGRFCDVEEASRPFALAREYPTLNPSPEGRETGARLTDRSMTRYAELAVTTNFSFLRGGSHPEELVEQAAALGLAGIGIADRNSFAGVVRAHVAVREWREREDGPSTRDLRLAIGTRLIFADGTPDILAYPENRAAYGRLCRLLTLGKRRAKKGECEIMGDDLLAHAEGVRFVVMGEDASADLPPLRGGIKGGVFAQSAKGRETGSPISDELSPLAEAAGAAYPTPALP